MTLSTTAVIAVSLRGQTGDICLGISVTVTWEVPTLRHTISVKQKDRFQSLATLIPYTAKKDFTKLNAVHLLSLCKIIFKTNPRTYWYIFPTLFRIPSPWKAGLHFRNLSRITIFTSSLLYNRLPLSCCLSGPNMLKQAYYHPAGKSNFSIQNVAG